MKKETNESTPHIDLSEARESLIELELQTGEMLKRYFNMEGYSIGQNNSVDFTTQAYMEADAFLRELIKQKYPQTQLLTEEAAPVDYSSLKNAKNLWVIDPLNGTNNFSRKHTNFAISAALVDKGVPQLGTVHIPMTGDTYWAQADKEGAFLNGKPIQVSSTKDIRDVVIACDWGWGLEKRSNVIRWLGNISTHVRQIKSMGSVASDLASLANGRIDAYIHSGLKPWDVAASVLLIEKAGGKITTPTGGKWDVFNTDLLATNGVLHEPIQKLINAR